MISVENNKILGISIQNNSKRIVLEKIIKNIKKKTEFIHIVSINPENVVVAQSDTEFKDILNRAQIKIVDGFGVLKAAQFLKIAIKERITGVDLMQTMLESLEKEPLRVLFIGGRENLAHQLAECYHEKRAQQEFKGIMGYKNVLEPTEEEEKEVISIIADYKPHLLFASFGSPAQEKWIWDHQQILKGTVAMGVGGGFDFLTGTVLRAPKLIRDIGMEWLFRLFLQPWRLKRQLRLFTFVYLVAKQKFFGYREV